MNYEIIELTFPQDGKNGVGTIRAANHADRIGNLQLIIQIFTKEVKTPAQEGHSQETRHLIKLDIEVGLGCSENIKVEGRLGRIRDPTIYDPPKPENTSFPLEDGETLRQQNSGIDDLEVFGEKRAEIKKVL